MKQEFYLSKIKLLEKYFAREQRKKKNTLEQAEADSEFKLSKLQKKIRKLEKQLEEQRKLRDE